MDDAGFAARRYVEEISRRARGVHTTLYYACQDVLLDDRANRGTPGVLHELAMEAGYTESASRRLEQSARAILGPWALREAL